MYRFRSGVGFAILFCAIGLSACATNPPKSETEELQRTAVQRWKACIARNADAEILPLKQVSRLMDRECEGHKRDVIALFPTHLASQVDKMLVGTAYRYIDSMHKTSSDSADADRAIRTLLR